MLSSYRNLMVWQKGIQLCVDIYRISKEFPKSDMYGLTSQIRRCCVSIPSNIAEGYHRNHQTEYKQFLYIAYGSGAELETQLLIALRIGYLDKTAFEKLNALLGEIMKMLNKLIKTLN